MPDGTTHGPSGPSYPLSIEAWSHTRRQFRIGGETLTLEYRVIEEDVQRDLLTPLIHVDPVARELLVGCAIGCANSEWRRWKSAAEKSGAFAFEDMLSQIQAIAWQAVEVFDPTRSANFVPHALGRIRQKIKDWALPEIHFALTGERVSASTLERYKRDDPRLGDKMRASIDLGGPELVSLNSRVEFDEGSSVEFLEITPDDALTPEDIVVGMEAAQAAREQINAFGFTDEESRALFLWIDELLSLNQIGEIMERSKNTIKARLTAAAEKMSLTFEDLEARRDLLKGAS